MNQRITDIILDFDGTCTQIPRIYEGFIRSYFEGFAKQMELLQMPITKNEWQEAIDFVRKNSPYAAWNLGGCWAAPAAADPYILTFEAACYILRDKKSLATPEPKIFGDAYTANPPPWREDAANTFIALQQKGVRLHFISNSSTKKIQDHLKLLPGIGNIPVYGDAAKFRVVELAWDPVKTGQKMPADMRKKFTDLPVAGTNPLLNSLMRPAYIRRGSYFDAICRALQYDPGRLETTLFCGDIWELDLAMPYELGANVHLLERASPFGTYDYERKIVSSYGDHGKIGNKLSSLLTWI